MNSVLKSVLLTLCAAALANAGDSFKSYTKDHYIACTTAHLAYQMPCAIMDAHGNRLHYVPTSGPAANASYCDYPHVVGCGIGITGSTGDPTLTPVRPSTTDGTVGPTASTTEKPGDDEKCPEEGATCDEKVDCKQCGDCDVYYKCDGGVWKKFECGKISIGGIVYIADKLFWNKNGTVHGGSCVHWADLTPRLQMKYREDPECKPICEYNPDPTCIRRYTYKNPDFGSGVWDSPPITLECAKETKWSQAAKTCVLCGPADDCTSAC